MFDIMLAGIRIRIENRHEAIYRRCKDYIVQADGVPDMTLIATDEELQFIMDDIDVPEDEAEVHCLPKRLYGILPKHNAFWMHGCAVEMDGGVYIFTARSGYGKTTHARLWLEAFKGRARIINGDNPLIECREDDFFAYGTPFAGKEGYNVNTAVPVKGVCYLTRSSENSIRRMHPQMAFAQLLQECYHRADDEYKEKIIDLIEMFSSNVPFYQLFCNQDVEAAHVAYEGMKHGGNHD